MSGARAPALTRSLAAALTVFGLSLASTSAASDLPSIDCLKALRSARVARMSSESATVRSSPAPGGATSETAHLLAAREPCADRLEWLHAMLDLERRSGLPPEAGDALHEELAQRLQDPELPVPEAVAEHLIYEPALDPRLRELVTGAYQRRVAAMVASGAEPSRRSLQTLVYLLESSGRLAEAAAALERLASSDPGETSDWSLVRLYRELERWDDAARVTARLVERSALHAGLFGPQLVRLLVRAGRPDEAFRRLEALEASAEGSLPASGIGPPLYLSLAWELRDAGLDGPAERMFRRALEQPAATRASLVAEIEQPAGDVAAEAALALLHFYAGEEERERLARRAAESAADSDDPFELYEAGTEALTSGRLEEALTLLERAAPGLPELEAVWYNLGLVAYRLDRFETAAAAYARAVELQPGRAEAWFFQGLALVSLERCADAVGPLETALGLDPGRVLAHYHLGQCYHRLGRAADGDRHLDAYQRAQGRP